MVRSKFKSENIKEKFRNFNENSCKTLCHDDNYLSIKIKYVDNHIDYDFDKKELADAFNEVMTIDVKELKIYSALNLQQIFHNFFGVFFVSDIRQKNGQRCPVLFRRRRLLFCVTRRRRWQPCRPQRLPLS